MTIFLLIAYLVASFCYYSNGESNKYQNFTLWLFF